MSFGGYKFAGYLVDNSQYSTSIERCAAIHAARIRAFLDASAKAGNPWIIDPAWKDGEFDINLSTGALSSNPGAGCIHDLIGKDGNSHGYLTYFKRDSSTSGYYAILTTDQYSISYPSSTTPTGLNFIQNECIYFKYTSSGTGYGPKAASCFHVMSLEPFGHAPSGSTNPDYMFLVNMTSKSTRLQSIGANNYDTSYPYNVTSGYVNLSMSSTYFGYAIKGDDVLVFSSYKGSSEAANPWNGETNTHVSVMSLNAFSELYCPNDTYGLLNYEVKNYCSQSDDSSKASYTKGTYNQILNHNGEQICKNTYTTDRYISPIAEAIATYTPSGTNSVPFYGLPMYLTTAYGESNVLSGNQFVKGRTKPEFLCANFSTSYLSIMAFSAVLDGSLLFLYSFNYSGVAYFLPSGSWSKGTAIPTGYYNTYIGWDSENPDISTDASWPTYTPDVSPLI